MQILRAGIDLEHFFRRLSGARQSVLLLDYDGVLAPFDEDREKAVPYPGVREILTALLEVPRTRVVMVSGRQVESLVRLLGLERAPEIWGAHGWEHRLPDGAEGMIPLDDRAASGLAEACAGLAAAGLLNRSERKRTSLAVHWRGLDPRAAQEMESTVRALWEPIGRATGLQPEEFDGGIELRTPGRDKGSVVQTILAEVEDDAVIAYLGDDRTDEAAFRVLAGRGLRLLVRPENRETDADLWLQPPAEMLAFLERWYEATATVRPC